VLSSLEALRLPIFLERDFVVKLANMTADTAAPVKTEDFAYDSKNQNSNADIENVSGDIEYSTFVVDKAIERELLWKFDLHILPMLALMYLFK
jgi:hypothetical protein